MQPTSSRATTASDSARVGRTSRNVERRRQDARIEPEYARADSPSAQRLRAREPLMPPAVRARAARSDAARGDARWPRSSRRASPLHGPPNTGDKLRSGARVRPRRRGHEAACPCWQRCRRKLRQLHPLVRRPRRLRSPYDVPRRFAVTATAAIAVIRTPPHVRRAREGTRVAGASVAWLSAGSARSYPAATRHDAAIGPRFRRRQERPVIRPPEAEHRTDMRRRRRMPRRSVWHEPTSPRDLREPSASDCPPQPASRHAVRPSSHCEHESRAGVPRHALDPAYRSAEHRG